MGNVVNADRDHGILFLKCVIFLKLFVSLCYRTTLSGHVTFSWLIIKVQAFC